MTCLLSRSNGLAACRVALCCVAMLVARGVQAAPKSENLLPDTTKGYVSVGDIAALRDSFNRSQWGLLGQRSRVGGFRQGFPTPVER